MTRSEPRPRRRRRTIAAASVMLSLLTGFLLAAEHDASARSLPQAVAASRPLQASLTPVAPAAVAPPAAPLLAPGATAGQVRSAGRRLAEQGLAGTAIVRVAAEAPLPVCAQLLASRAQLIAQFTALIAAFPGQAAILTAQLNAALAVIGAQLAGLGCPIPSG